MIISTKRQKEVQSSLILAPNWKDIQCTLTAERLHDGIIIQWNIHNGVGGGGINTQMDDSKT